MEEKYRYPNLTFTGKIKECHLVNPSEKILGSGKQINEYSVVFEFDKEEDRNQFEKCVKTVCEDEWGEVPQELSPTTYCQNGKYYLQAVSQYKCLYYKSAYSWKWEKECPYSDEELAGRNAALTLKFKAFTGKYKRWVIPKIVRVVISENQA